MERCWPCENDEAMENGRRRYRPRDFYELDQNVGNLCEINGVDVTLVTSATKLEFNEKVFIF